MRLGSPVRRFGALLFLVLLVGCVPKKILVHDPPLAKNVHTLVRGQTTKSEILSQFGVPDIEGDGINSKVNPNTPLARWWGEFLKAEVGWANVLPYSSIDSDYEVLFYVEFFGRGALGAKSGAPALAVVNDVTFGPLRGQVAKNRLLVFVNKKTGIVEEFAYREEFRRD